MENLPACTGFAGPATDARFIPVATLILRRQHFALHRVKVYGVGGFI